MKSNEGSCLATIIVFFILVFLPAMVTGDDFGWGVLIVWWIILAVICWIIYECTKPTTQASGTATTYHQSNGVQKNLVTNQDKGLPLNKSNTNVSLTSKYNAKLQYKANIEKEVRDLSDEVKKAQLEIDELKKSIKRIENYSDKPFLMSKKKYMNNMRSVIEENNEKITGLEEKIELVHQRIVEKERVIRELRFPLFEESNKAFDTLKKAIEAFKKSCKVEGSIGIKGSAISAYQKNKDLSFIEYKTEPYGLNLGGSRFYIFPTSVWVYEGENNLVGIFKPKVVGAKFEYRENIKYSYRNYTDIADDTKIITKDIPHTTWLHTCRDGSPDLRYSHNPQRTYYTQQEYYLECSFELILCGYTLKYKVSSYDNCEMLQEAIKQYSVVKESVDIIPIILKLLERCTDGNDVAYINKKIMGN